jgi:cytochrome P450
VHIGETEMASSETIPDATAYAVVNPAAYADGRTARDAFAWLRANNPLGKAELEGNFPFWVVTKHADILEISRQNDLFRSGDRSTTFTTVEGDARVRQMTGGSPHLVRTLVQMDAPDHPKYRLLTQAWFLPQNIRPWRTAFAGSRANTSTGWRKWAASATSPATSP